MIDENFYAITPKNFVISTTADLRLTIILKKILTQSRKERQEKHNIKTLSRHVGTTLRDK